MVLLQVSWRRGFEDSRVQAFVFQRFYQRLSTLSTSSVSSLRAFKFFWLFYGYSDRVYTTFTKPSDFCNYKAFHSNPWTLDPLNPLKIINFFGDDPILFTLVFLTRLSTFGAPSVDNDPGACAVRTKHPVFRVKSLVVFD